MTAEGRTRKAVLRAAVAMVPCCATCAYGVPDRIDQIHCQKQATVLQGARVVDVTDSCGDHRWSPASQGESVKG